VGFGVFVEHAAGKSADVATENITRCCTAANSTVWDNLFSVNLTADSIWSAFCDILNDVIDQFVPVNNTGTRQTRKCEVKHYPNSIKKALDSSGGATPGPGRSYMPCHSATEKNRTWSWDLSVIFRWVRLPSEFCAYHCFFGFSVLVRVEC